VGYNEFPPFVIPVAGGPPQGLATEIVALAAKRAGIDIRWVSYPVSTEEAFRQDKIDVYPMLTMTPERVAKLHFSQAWWENAIVLVSLASHPVNTEADTAGKRVAIRGIGIMRSMAGSLFPKADLITILKMEKMPAALCEGSVDAFFLDVRLVESLMLAGPAACAGKPLHVTPVQGGVVDLGTASSQAKAQVADRLYREILNLSADGTLTKVASRWSLFNPYSRALKEAIDTQRRATILRYSLTAMVLVVVVIGFQARRLRRAKLNAEQATRDAEDTQHRFDAFMQHTPAATYIKDADGRLLFVNDAYCKLFGKRPEEIVGKTPFDIMAAEDAAELRRNDCEVLANNASKEVIETVHDPAGVAHHFLSLKFPFSNRRGEKLLAGVSLDITERRQAEEALRFSQFSIDRSADSILWVDAQTRIIYANEAACQTLGYSREDLMSLQFGNIDPTFSRKDILKTIEKLKAAGSMMIESIHRTRDGRNLPVELSLNYLESDGHAFVCCHCRDITRRKRAERELEKQAQHDLLTGLPNRRLLVQQLGKELEKSQEASLAVIYLDLDGFKFVNDTLGHHAGDELLQRAAQRLSSYVPTGGILARMGGDEFTLVLPGLKYDSEAQSVAEKLLASLERGFEVEGNELTIGASVGISMFPRDGLDVSSLLQTSDAAMYAAKHQGKNRVQFFTPEMGQEARERLELENYLRRAIERGELSLHYQPQFGPGTASVVRFEALLRWKNPVLGSVSPMKFIPVAEEAGLIVSIGNWVLEQACRDAKKWHDGGERRGTGVAVNVSTIQFVRPDYVDQVFETLRRTGLPPHLLELEITESVVIHGVDEVVEKIERLRERGISIAIDDFGTGYSSLSYLQRLPLDCLKIDRAFVRDIAGNNSAAAFTESLVSLAHSLGMRVVAEGVETEAQYEAIGRMGCDLVQGFLLGRPMPVAEALCFDHVHAA
jgi:diguanylate cyclase (GGDEF)-like protein/PAS domain S-box-containing protein